MESPTLAAEAVPADVSEFFRAELDAFVAMHKRLRPTSWARVEKLQQVCRSESPASSTGFTRSVRLLDERYGPASMTPEDLWPEGWREVPAPCS